MHPDLQLTRQTPKSGSLSRKCQQHILGVQWQGDIHHIKTARHTGLSLLLDLTVRWCSALFGHSQAWQTCLHTKYSDRNYYYCHFTALCPGLSGWASTRKKNIHPLTPILIINHPPSTTIHSILPVQFTYLTAFCTTSVQVFFGLILSLTPSTSYSIHFFIQSLSCGSESDS